MRRDKRCSIPCPHCGGGTRVHRQRSLIVYDMPLACHAAVWVTIPAIQVKCRNCSELSTPRPAEIHPTRNATWRFMRTVAAWASICPANKVAAMFEIGERTVNRYEQDVLAANLPAPELDGLEVLMVDEKAVRKKHGYVTVVLNGMTGELLHMAEGKKKESLESFFETLNEEQRASIHSVCLDRAGAYRSATQKHLPHASIVFDRFHIMANLNAALDEVRRQEWRQAAQAGKKVIKGSRYLVSASPENLDEKGLQRLEEIKELNTNLALAYALKEEFRLIYTMSNTVHSARLRLRRWSKTVKASKIEAMVRFAKSIERDFKEVTAFFELRLTSGLIESFNNQIARLIHRAYGMTNLKHLFLKMRAQSLQQI
ncbi:ISL3 family transposase [Roseibacillus persicicus]|uniref:ISL3 family transposase n=1 Tax=Roseibacillus persicicus TaxID=454148 RepID=UPI0028107E88|nr:ISL3 family transposase [Roseibacillus persicicus]MDQ8191970.1 ISL3 family transposase [Roseibacillus persicicus]